MWWITIVVEVFLLWQPILTAIGASQTVVSAVDWCEEEEREELQPGAGQQFPRLDTR